MDNESGSVINNEAIQILIQQFETLLIFLQRPTVLRQLVALVLVTVGAYLVSRVLHMLSARLSHFLLSEQDENLTTRRVKRWMPRIGLLYFPVSSLGGLAFAIQWFQTEAFRNGILLDATLVFWVIFAYRIIVTVLYTLLSEARVQPYHRYILNPLFVIVVGGRVLGNVFDIGLVGQIELATILDTPVMLSNLLGAVLVFYVFLVISWIIRDGLTSIVLPRIKTNPGAVNSILTLTRYVVLMVGIFASLGSLGFDLTTLALIGGSLSVGIGFGLQQIVANFISGVVLLFEQSLRPGDIIDIDGKLGTVQKLSIRSTTVRTFENVEVIVPNERFLTSSVTTYTGTDQTVRGSLFVGAGYDSDPKIVRDILLDAARRHGVILKRPEPVVLFTGYGDSSIDFRLDFWVGNAGQIVIVRSDLYFIIWEAFAKHYIEIPFPQRDLNLKRGWADLFANTNPPDEDPEKPQS